MIILANEMQGVLIIYVTCIYWGDSEVGPRKLDQASPQQGKVDIQLSFNNPFVMSGHWSARVPPL